MTGSHTRLTPLAALPIVLLACSTAPGGGGGGSGGSPGSGGTTTATGGTASSGGSATGGGSSGGTNSGGASSGGSEGNGDGGDGLGGESATGGADASGGSTGVGGSGGSSQTMGYAVCDGDLGMEDNPGCAEGELCVANACTELCPLNDIDAAMAYECPASPGPAEAMSRCQTFIGRCILQCALQGGPTYSCPDGMECVGEACGWPD